ncbi:ficolin-1-like [Liolophura sinensis]|uniref:ficolin-1-like n=1 Tax=Liolophura sinensis TaxID=3198878 RepID=UPI00315949E9
MEGTLTSWCAEALNIVSTSTEHGEEYRRGFGSIEGDYWLGLEQFHMVAQTQEYLDVALIDGSGNETILYYRHFNVDDEAGEYSIVAMDFQRHRSNPDAVDSFTPPTNQSISGKPFITYDHNPSGSSCPTDMRSGWWFGDGVHSGESQRAGLDRGRIQQQPFTTENYLD